MKSAVVSALEVFYNVATNTLKTGTNLEFVILVRARMTNRAFLYGANVANSSSVKKTNFDLKIFAL